jgi:ATP-dependent DNA helicase RecQ
VTFLNSTVADEDHRERRKCLWNGGYHLLYVTPEQLGSESVLRILTEGGRKVIRVAIDEAHCVSEWGHSFRVEYLLLRDALARLGSPPVLLLTATAPPEVRKDVVTQLGIELNPRKNADLVIDHYRREELEPSMIEVRGRRSKYGELRKFVQERGKGTRGIVYTRFATACKEDGYENCQEIAQWLEEKNLGPVAVYHGQLPTDAKGVEQKRFTEGEARIIVATNAFGLGIDLPKIDWVVHFYMPPSFLDYYQEIGRGGRGMEVNDGDRCECLILYDRDDRELVEGLVQGNVAGADKIARRFRQLIEGKSGQHGLRGQHEVLYDDARKVLLLPFRPMKTQYTVRIAHMLALQDIGVVERLPNNLFRGDNVYAQFVVKREEMTVTDQKKLEKRQGDRRETLRNRLDGMQRFCEASDNDVRWDILDREFNA